VYRDGPELAERLGLTSSRRIGQSTLGDDLHEVDPRRLRQQPGCELRPPTDPYALHPTHVVESRPR
jgi:hypothetical protein